MFVRVLLALLATVFGVAAAVLLGLMGVVMNSDGLVAGARWDEESSYGIPFVALGFILWISGLLGAVVPWSTPLSRDQTRRLRPVQIIVVSTSVLVVAVAVFVFTRF